MRSCALLGLLVFWTLLDSSDCLEAVVRPDAGWTVTVSSKLPEDQCSVCTVSGVNGTDTACQASVSVAPEVETKLLFKCSEPVDQGYAVELKRTIECTKDACSPSTVDAQPTILTELSRTFSWEVKVPEKTIARLTILGESVKEATGPCQDGFQYSVETSRTNPTPDSRTRYCKGGSVTDLDLQNEAVVSLEVKPGVQVEPVVFQASAGPLKGPTVVISFDPSTSMALSRDPGEPECDVCSNDGLTRDCSAMEKMVTSAKNLLLQFGCLKPQDVFTVTTWKKIECTTSNCTPAAGEVDPELLKDFKRSLTWDISVPEKTVLSLDFPGGLKELSDGESCQAGLQYSVRTTKSNREVKTKSYCRGGPVLHLNLPGATTVTTEVSKGQDVEPAAFTAKAAPRGSRMISVVPDPNTIIRIMKMGDDDCSVCENKGPDQVCKPGSLTLKDPTNTSVEFTCERPQDLYTVEINREIDCTESACSGNIVQAESSLFPDFNRTFTWDLKVVSNRAFQLDFPEPGMRQIPNEDACPDGHTYSLVTYLRTGPATIGTFCKGGAVTTVSPRYKGRMSLQVPGDRKLDPVDFKLTVGPETSMVAIMKVNLPRGLSDTAFITANYPGDYPDDQQMQWDFTVPGMHNYTVHFVDHSAPECLSKEVEVVYQKEGKKPTQLTLTDPQPEHQQGSFSMVLKNCETNRTLPGLALSYKVSVMRSGHPVLCTVDLTSLDGVSVQIEKVGSDPYCEMSIDSEVKEKIIVAAGAKASLSFLDCPQEDLRLTASRVIGCQTVGSCPSTLLRVPKLPSCLRMPLHSFSWNLTMPKDSTADLTSPTGTLRQSLPGQECNRSAVLHLEEADGLSIGDFCFTGAIRKIQVHANMSVTVSARDFSRTKGPFLNVSFSQEIPETIIYRVTPSSSAPTLLATPNWPRGTRSSSTVSWIVSLPSQYQAQMQFVNISQPKCQDRHTATKVQLLGHEEEMMSRREDEQVEEQLVIPKSFYLNMSNCVPENGEYGALVKLVLEKKINLLAILLGIAGAVLLLLVVLAVVCIVTKKKKKERMKTEASIYMGRGNIFRPGDRHFSKARSDNESHVYDSIDETMVYGHLLGDSTYTDSITDNYKGLQVDSYQTFTGPTDGDLPVIKEPDNEPETDQYKGFLDPADSFHLPRPRTPIDRQDSLGFQDRRMVDNELYTFRSTGDINTIRLSGADMEPQPEE